MAIVVLLVCLVDLPSAAQAASVKHNGGAGQSEQHSDTHDNTKASTEWIEIETNGQAATNQLPDSQSSGSTKAIQDVGFAQTLAAMQKFFAYGIGPASPQAPSKRTTTPTVHATSYPTSQRPNTIRSAPAQQQEQHPSMSQTAVRINNVVMAVSSVPQTPPPSPDAADPVEASLPASLRNRPPMSRPVLQNRLQLISERALIFSNYEQTLSLLAHHVNIGEKVAELDEARMTQFRNEVHEATAIGAGGEALGAVAEAFVQDSVVGAISPLTGTFGGGNPLEQLTGLLQGLEGVKLAANGGPSDPEAVTNLLAALFRLRKQHPAIIVDLCYPLSFYLAAKMSACFIEAAMTIGARSHLTSPDAACMGPVYDQLVLARDELTQVGSCQSTELHELLLIQMRVMTHFHVIDRWQRTRRSLLEECTKGLKQAAHRSHLISRELDARAQADGTAETHDSWRDAVETVKPTKTGRDGVGLDAGLDTSALHAAERSELMQHYVDGMAHTSDQMIACEDALHDTSAQLSSLTAHMREFLPALKLSHQ